MPLFGHQENLSCVSVFAYNRFQEVQPPYLGFKKSHLYSSDAHVNPLLPQEEVISDRFSAPPHPAFDHIPTCTCSTSRSLTVDFNSKTVTVHLRAHFGSECFMLKVFKHFYNYLVYKQNFGHASQLLLFINTLYAYAII